MEPSGLRAGEGTPEGTSSSRRSGGWGLPSVGVSSSVRADPESFDGVSESVLLWYDSSMMGNDPGRDASKWTG